MRLGTRGFKVLGDNPSHTMQHNLRVSRRRKWIGGFWIAWMLSRGIVAAEERFQSFDADPAWDGRNNRSAIPAEEVKMDFGWSPTRHAGGSRDGELGGFIMPAGEPAYVAKPISPATFESRLSASGKLACTGRQFHALVGFFNSNTVNEWRTPNSIALRLYGRGDFFYAYVEYCTGQWRAGGDSPGGFSLVPDPQSGKPQLRGFASQGVVHEWSLEYDPAANGGAGRVTVTIGQETAICDLSPGHKEDGAVFNRFGLLNVVKSADDGGELWLDDITVNGQTEHFDADLGWDESGNRRTYLSASVRPKFDFGYSPTHFAGGRRSGELGGLVFRGDAKAPEFLAYYGDKVGPLSPAKPLRASGKLSLRRGVSDSTTLIGFFDAETSMATSEAPSSGFPMNFVGLAIEGPSSEGFYLYPAYRVSQGADGYARGPELPRILPNGESHDWAFEYSPSADNGRGQVTVTLDGRSHHGDLPSRRQESPARLNRFGIVTTWIDGNGQQVFFDDLSYSIRQD